MKTKKIISIILAAMLLLSSMVTVYASDYQIQPRYYQIVRAFAGIEKSGNTIDGSCTIVTNGNYTVRVQLYLQTSETGNDNDWSTYQSIASSSLQCNGRVQFFHCFNNVPRSEHYRIKAYIKILNVSPADSITVYSDII